MCSRIKYFFLSVPTSSPHSSHGLYFTWNTLFSNFTLVLTVQKKQLMTASSHCFNFCLTIPEVLWRTAHFLLSTLPVHNCTKIWTTHFCWDRCPPNTAVKCCAVVGECLWIKPLNIFEMKLYYYWTCHQRVSINFSWASCSAEWVPSYIKNPILSYPLLIRDDGELTTYK